MLVKVQQLPYQRLFQSNQPDHKMAQSEHL